MKTPTSMSTSADGMVRNLGDIRLTPSAFDQATADSEAFLFDEEEVLDDEGLGQSIGTIQGATDDVYYQTANYDFSIARFRFRGYEQNWQAGYVNGFRYNDAMRGRFNYSMFGGMTSSGIPQPHPPTSVSPRRATDSATSAWSEHPTPPTHPNMPRAGRKRILYQLQLHAARHDVRYATGLNRHGWAFTMSIIGRYAPEGVIEGTFYNSFGYFLSLQKVFNDKHSLNISTLGCAYAARHQRRLHPGRPTTSPARISTTPAGVSSTVRKRARGSWRVSIPRLLSTGYGSRRWVPWSTPA